jgi:prepilin-type N-terminal cleavage/methylation domain-containing protein
MGLKMNQSTISGFAVQSQYKPKSGGFTLVELSIVLVIIGLIVGGVVGGQSLVKSAKVNKVVTQFQEYTTAVRSFEMQYDALPGDFSEAWDYWGTNCQSSALRCNGNGDYFIETGTGYYQQENIQFWNHMLLAEVISASSTEYATMGAGGGYVLGVNIPEAPFASTGFIANSGGWGSRAAIYGKYGNVIILGGAVVGDGAVNRGAVTPESAKSIDKKMDDGSPSAGQLRVTRTEYRIDGSLVYNVFDCVGDGNASTAAPASYNLSSTFTSCRMAYFLD